MIFFGPLEDDIEGFIMLRQGSPKYCRFRSVDYYGGGNESCMGGHLRALRKTGFASTTKSAMIAPGGEAPLMISESDRFDQPDVPAFLVFIGAKSEALADSFLGKMAISAQFRTGWREFSWQNANKLQVREGPPGSLSVCLIFDLLK